MSGGETAPAWKTLGSTGHACAPGRCNHPDSADYNPDYVPDGASTPEPTTYAVVHAGNGLDVTDYDTWSSIRIECALVLVGTPEQAASLRKAAAGIEKRLKAQLCARAATARRDVNEGASREILTDGPSLVELDAYGPAVEAWCASCGTQPTATGSNYCARCLDPAENPPPLSRDLSGDLLGLPGGRPPSEADAAATLAATGLARPQAADEEEAEDVQSDPERTAYIIGLRKLADILESNPVVPLPLNSGAPYSPVLFGFHGSVAREELAAAVRAFPTSFAKDADGKWLNLDGKLAGLHVQLYASREQVCTRRVVGTEEREVEVEVTPAVTEKRTETFEVVEWTCEPILGEPEREEAPTS